MFAYIEAVDAAGHADGPDSEAVNSSVQATDDALAKFFTDLEDAGLLSNTGMRECMNLSL